MTAGTQTACQKNVLSGGSKAGHRVPESEFCPHAWGVRSVGLSELELVILGVVWKREPCTSYAVAKEFATSPSSHYSGSAGAVYPAVARLVLRGYIQSIQSRQGRRHRRLHRITSKGRTALSDWLHPPLPEDAARITYDPIRTRVYFLGILSPQRRREFLADAERQLEQQIPWIEGECERYRAAGNEFSALAMRGALHVVQARLDWIAEVRRCLAC
jgi:DNA-binding PadR family transcriptional regulator